MKKLIGKMLLLLLGFTLSNVSLLTGANAVDVAKKEHLMSKEHSKDGVPITIFYTPVSTGLNGASGFWQLQIVDINGHVIVDDKNGPIAMQNPPTGPLHFTTKRLEPGLYMISLYVTNRTNSTPVDLNDLVINFAIQPSNGQDFMTVPFGFFAANPASTQRGDTAQVTYSLYNRSRHQ